MKGRKDGAEAREERNHLRMGAAPALEPPGIPFNYCGLPHRHSRLPWAGRVSLLLLRWCDRSLKVADVGVQSGTGFNHPSLRNTPATEDRLICSCGLSGQVGVCGCLTVG